MDEPAHTADYVRAVEGPRCSNCGCLAGWHRLDDQSGRYPCEAPVTTAIRRCGCKNYVGELHG
jgi:hypothetical protein